MENSEASPARAIAGEEGYPSTSKNGHERADAKEGTGARSHGPTKPDSSDAAKVPHRKLNPLATVDPQANQASEDAGHILVVGDRVEVIHQFEGFSDPVGKQGTITYLYNHTSQRTGKVQRQFCVRWDETGERGERHSHDDELAINNGLYYFSTWTHMFKIINRAARQRSKENAFSSEEPVTFREATGDEINRGIWWGNRIWYFNKGIHVEKNVVCFSSDHDGEMYPCHNDITMGSIIEIANDQVTIEWTKHVACCWHDINESWRGIGPYSKIESYDFSDVNMSWTGIKDFSAKGLTPKDAVLTMMMKICCVYNEFPIANRCSPIAGWETLAAVPCLRSVVLTVESFEGDALRLRGVGGASVSIPASLSDTVSQVVPKVCEALNLLGSSVQLVTEDGMVLGDDAIVGHGYCHQAAFKTDSKPEADVGQGQELIS